jgi:DNA methylase
VKSESSQGSHSAPFPRALVEFFLQAFSDEGDVVYDPFMGSGTTMAAAASLGRVGYGCEISPAYCDVILSRVMHLTGGSPVHTDTGEPFGNVAATRGMPADQALRDDWHKDGLYNLKSVRGAPGLSSPVEEPRRSSHR